MTRTLNAAIEKLAALPAEQQDRVARWVLDELADEEQWKQRFDASQGPLAKLAEEARAARAAGDISDIDPNNL